MKKEEFVNSPSGRLVATERKQWAFVPYDLPPANLDVRPLAQRLSVASRLLGELNGIGRTLPDPYLLIRPLQVREALTSSSMEGTYTTIDDLLLLEAGAGEQNRPADTREVFNYRRALSQAIESLERVPLSLRTLREAHKTLLTGVRRHRGANVRAGEFKEHQNFIGAYEIENARFIPPPRDEAMAALDKLEKYIQREDADEIPDLVDAALIHYQFEAIHPFADGNGRVGRMLITLHLYMKETIRQPLLYLSPVFESRKDEYIDRLYNVSRYGAWTEWIAFFLDVVADACKKAIATADALLALQKDYRSRLRRAGRSANLVEITDLLFRAQVVSIPMIAGHLQVQYRSAQLNVESLVGVGILEEIAGTSNPKYFIAREIRDIISDV
ncbi:MAG: Fic family protein [Variibacter sp.]|nr:Fic family protein [Variibacter sp.]